MYCPGRFKSTIEWQARIPFTKNLAHVALVLQWRILGLASWNGPGPNASEWSRCGGKILFTKFCNTDRLIPHGTSVLDMHFLFPASVTRRKKSDFLAYRKLLYVYKSFYN